MEEQIELADFVLLICTETYYRRYRGKEMQGGYGVNFEGLVISQSLYQTYYKNNKFIPALPEHARFEDVPLPLQPYTVFSLMADYEALYRVLTEQPAVHIPEVGARKTFPPESGSAAEASTAPTKPVPPAQATADLKPPQPDQKTMSDTLKAAWIGAFFVLLAALITGLFSLYSGVWNPPSKPNIGTHIGDTYQAGRDININGQPAKEQKP